MNEKVNSFTMSVWKNTLTGQSGLLNFVVQKSALLFPNNLIAG